MTQQELEELALIVNKDIEHITENETELYILSIFMVNLVTFCLQLPVGMFKYTPKVLRILANALDMMQAEYDTDGKRH